MDALGAGLITWFNGLVTFLGSLTSPVTLAVIAVVVSLAWLALVEIEQQNLRGAKPTVALH